jgi:hypothetical protein
MIRRELPAASVAVLAALVLLAALAHAHGHLLGGGCRVQITFPLTFGWIRFTLVPPVALVPPDLYQLWFFGFPVFQFPIEAGTGFRLCALKCFPGVHAAWARV